MEKSTQELLDILKSTENINEYIQVQQQELLDLTLPELLEKLMDIQQLSKADVIRASGLDRIYAYQIFSGTKKPSLNKLLALSCGMHLTLDQTQQLLKSAGYPILYARKQWDSVVIFSILKQLTLPQVNDLLYELNLPLIE
ncbi:hypothetical protein [Diplocloster modestus]|uniref:XRE family transcriptional regulator n=1 Tax=Diplocloster modestus TaxID=2850322 RepID=A0ABS6KD19_9FIRM|nr:hypothetical protein [Diplocloster modestus]MBU9728393.1 hypothetical protein [Diplocloster modestus]